jgi:4-alpha-glucanotransferase
MDRQVKTRFKHFCEENAAWLRDYALFIALKESQGGHSWLEWDKSLKMRNPEALTEFEEHNLDAIQEQAFRQFLFFEQWNNLKEYAHSNGIKIIGDVPIFVSMDSADVWAHRELFFIDPKGNPTFIAGVPPDYFSPTGQLWGNPLYNWKKHHETSYAWWIERMRASLLIFDWIRLDHFRGFAAYWKIRAGSPTAEFGKWEKGPGAALFMALNQALGDLPIIAEDLGVITPDVVALREQFGFPGMCILQFAFGGDPGDRFLPHNYIPNSVVYTGTHDNDTSLGWFTASSIAQRELCLKYLNRDGTHITADMIRAIWSSVASFAIAPMQDFLNLDTHARMNYPSKADGNWCWRMLANAVASGLSERIKDLNFLYSR